MICSRVNSFTAHLRILHQAEDRGGHADSVTPQPPAPDRPDRLDHKVQDEAAIAAASRPAYKTARPRLKSLTPAPPVNDYNYKRPERQNRGSVALPLILCLCGGPGLN